MSGAVRRSRIKAAGVPPEYRGTAGQNGGTGASGENRQAPERCQTVGGQRKAPETRDLRQTREIGKAPNETCGETFSETFSETRDETRDETFSEAFSETPG